MVYEEAVVMKAPFDEAVGQVRSAFADQGFGILTEIDLQQTLHAKLGVEMGRHLILGACNPHLAARALEVIPEIGVLLPCNVAVRESDAGVVVEAMDPGLMASITDNDDIKPIADEARVLVGMALNSLLARA